MEAPHLTHEGPLSQEYFQCWLLYVTPLFNIRKDHVLVLMEAPHLTQEGEKSQVASLKIFDEQCKQN